jgi:hypothetical protein
MLQRKWQLFTGIRTTRSARRQSRRLLAGLTLGLACALAQGTAHARSVMLVHSDVPSFAVGTQSKLMATGLFTTVDIFDATAATPALADLTPFDAVLAWTDDPAFDRVALGNVLADYVDAGHGLVLGDFDWKGSLSIGGRITDPGFEPFLNVGVNADVSGNINALVPGDPIFTGVNLGALTYLHDVSFTHPALAAGSTLLADDGAGIPMIARNASGSVLAYNIWPSGIPGNNDELFKLIGNGLNTVGAQAPTPTPVPVTPVPEPASLALLGLGGLPLLRRLRPRRTA